MEQEKKVILLAGPTASGKSKLALQLAKNLNGEIINADSMQVYNEIFILTSRPTLQDTNIVKHHLYGFNSVKQKFSTGHWLKMAINKIKEQWNQDRIPILVGGTGLYFKALTDGLVKIPDIPNDLRTEIRELHKKIGQKKFYNKLIKLDPLVKKFLLASDSQRSMRAYEVKKLTNKSLFTFTKKTKSNFNSSVFKKLFINTPRELLHKKIEKRVEKMFNDGAVDEVKKFYKMKVNKELSSNKIIGIKEINDYLPSSAEVNLSRGGLAKFAFIEFKKFIFFGYGGGGFEYLFKINYQNLSTNFASHAHSSIIEFIGEFGLIGSTFISLSLLFTCANKKFFSFKNFLLCYLLIFILIFDFSFHIPIIQFLFILLLSVSYKRSDNFEYRFDD